MFDDEIRSASLKYAIPEPWIRSVIQIESSFNPNAYRLEAKISDASYGLMQLLFTTAKGLGFDGSPDELFDPAINIDLGTKLLAQLRTRYGDNVQRIISAYNSGNPDAYLTSDSVKTHVEKFMLALQQWMTKDPLVATSGAAGALILIILFWFWKGKK